MDSESVNDYLERIRRRHQIQDSLDISRMSEGGVEKESYLPSITETKEQKQDMEDISFIDSSSVGFEKENSPACSLKSKLSGLSEKIKTGEVDLKPNKVTKESVMHGPGKRLSVGGSEKSAPEFFAPKIGFTGSPNTSSNQHNLSTPPVGVHKSAASSTPRGNEEPPKLTFSPVMKINSENDCSDNKLGENQSGVLFFDESTTAEFAKTESKMVTKIVEEKTLSVSSVVSEVSNTGSQSSSFGGKVKALKNMFDSQTNGSKTESSIDGSSTNFQKARGLFESPVAKYQSPSVLKKNQGFTSVKRYDGPPPPSFPYSKKPASCEIVTGPTFSDSVNYWKGRVRENPEPNDDLMDAALFMATKSQKREATKTPGQIFRLSANDRSNELISPVPKVYKLSETDEEELVPNLPHILEEHEVADSEDEKADFMDDVENSKSESVNNASNSADRQAIINDSGCFNSWNEKFKIKPFVMTESFVSEKGPSDSSNSITVASESFDYQRFSSENESPKKQTSFAVSKSSGTATASNCGSLLDDINQEITKFHTPKKQFDSDDDSVSGRRLAHSLSHYRRNEATPKAIPVRTKDVVDELVSLEKSMTDNFRYMTEKERNDKIEQLDNMVQLQYKHVSQIGAALMTLRKEGKFTGTLTEVECLRKITIANERRRACMLEANFLKDNPVVSYMVPRAKIIFNKVTVSVCRNLAPAANHYIYLFVMIKHRDQIAASKPICVNEVLHRGIGVVEFTDRLEIEKASADFSVIVEVYGATLVIKEQKMDKGIFNLKKIMNSPAPERSNANSGPEQFSRIGQLTLTANDLHNSAQRTLAHVEYPVEPRIAFSYSCQVTDTDDSEWQGFISIYRVVEDRGAWELNFGKIANGRLKLWKYPKDAEKTAPLYSLNFRDMSEPARPSNDEELGFQYDFTMKMIDARDCIRTIMLSTAEEDERTRVLATINRSYKFYKTWA